MATSGARVGVRELRRDLSGYLRRAAQGESISVTSRDRVIAELIPPTSAEARERGRGRGSLAGKIRMADDFDEWPEDVLASFEAPLL